MSTFAEFQAETASEKIGLVQLEASRQVIDWTLSAGAVYSALFTDSPVITLFEESSIGLTEVATEAAVVAGTFFHDRPNGKIFMEASDSGNPNDKFMGVTFRLFFSNNGVKQPNDLSTGFDVLWLPLLQSTSQFGVEIDNKDVQLGFAIEGKGTISFHNDQEFWQPRYDKLIFENQNVFIYSWNRDVPIADAKLIYQGKIQTKSYSLETISFGLKDVLNELRAPVSVPSMQSLVYTHDVLGSISARIKNDLKQARQRTVYGVLNGHVCTNVDQVIENGYPMVGTMAVTNGSSLVIGTSTNFPEEVKQNDRIRFASQPDREYTIAFFDDLDEMVLSEDFDGTTTGSTTGQFFPEREIQSVNRFFLLAGHELTEPSTTISAVTSSSRFRVASTNGLEATNTVTINGVARTIQAIEDVDNILLTQALPAVPSLGDAVVRSPVTNAFLNDDLLVLNVDYTLDAETAILQLERSSALMPEIRLSARRSLIGGGTIDKFTAGSLEVKGNKDAQFDAELAPGDWLLRGTGELLQVWAITDKRNLIVTAPALTTTAGVGEVTLLLRPDYFTDGESILSVDLIGKSDTGLKSGDLLRKGPEIVKDILIDGGLSDRLNASSFDTANDLATHDLGIAIPTTFNNRNTQSLRATINRINKSIFGSLFQNDDFLLEYSVLEPERLIKDTVDRSDILGFSVRSDSTKIISAANISFNFKEADFEALNNPSNEVQSFTGDVGLNLVKTKTEFDLDTLLVDESSALIFASRWVFLLQRAKTIVEMQLKLQAFDYEINDKIQLSHPKFFERIGGNFLRKIGLVQSITKDITSSTVVIDDLANAFSRCGAITDNDAADFTDASDDELMENGYITDNNGVLGGDPDTFGVSVIW